MNGQYELHTVRDCPNHFRYFTATYNGAISWWTRSRSTLRPFIYLQYHLGPRSLADCQLPYYHTKSHTLTTAIYFKDMQVMFPFGVRDEKTTE
jgi:hypothetical protein